jgi:hypothetical protein
MNRYMDAKYLKDCIDSLTRDEKECNLLIWKRKDAIDAEDFVKAHEMKGRFYLIKETAATKLKHLPRYLNEYEVNRIM